MVVVIWIYNNWLNRRSMMVVIGIHNNYISSVLIRLLIDISVSMMLNK
jgi:hypothetical protein